MDTLTSGGRLNMNDSLQSANGQYRLVMQGDGNLVLYQGTPAGQDPVWATHTFTLVPNLRPTYAEMQTDGNFVLYNNDRVPAWATGTVNHPNSKIELQDDRNLVLYDAVNAPLWATGTNIGGPAAAVAKHQQDNVGGFLAPKKMTSDVTLYTNGLMVCNTHCECLAAISGLRGRVLIAAVDARGQAIWVSDTLVCPTCCAVGDVSCASSNTHTFTENWPAPVGQYAVRLDIYQGDDANYADLIGKLTRAMCFARDSVPALKQYIDPKCT